MHNIAEGQRTAFLEGNDFCTCLAGNYHSVVSQSFEHDIDNIDIVVGPIVGTVTNTTAIVMVEVNKNLSKLSCVIVNLNRNGSYSSSSPNASYAFLGETFAFSSNSSYGVVGSSDNYDSGPVVAGNFIARNVYGSSGNRTGIISEVEGSSVLSIGIKTHSRGSGDNFGLISEVTGGSTSVAGKFLANSNATNNFQLMLEEKENDFARISFRNINGDGWHQAANKGADAASSQFNFYYVPNASDVFSLTGNGNALLAGTLTQSSDWRLKNNIQPINNVLQKINEVRGVYFNWKDENRSQNKQIGFIAQEIEKVFPELVNTDSKGFKSVAYANMSAVLLEAIKEQNQRINALERELSEIKTLLKNSLNYDSKNAK
jgi:hypothetical protein